MYTLYYVYLHSVDFHIFCGTGIDIPYHTSWILWNLTNLSLSCWIFGWANFFHLVQGQEWKVEMLMGIIGNLTSVLVPVWWGASTCTCHLGHPSRVLFKQSLQVKIDVFHYYNRGEMKELAMTLCCFNDKHLQKKAGPQTDVFLETWFLGTILHL